MFRIGLLFLQYCGKNCFKGTPCPVLNSALWLVGIETIPQEPPRTVSSNLLRHLCPCLVVFWHGGVDQYSDEDSRRTLYWSLSLFLFPSSSSFSPCLSPLPLTPPLSLSFPPSCLACPPVNSGCLDLPRFPALIYPTPREKLWDLPESSPPALWSGSCPWAVHWDSSRATVGSLFFRE